VARTLERDRPCNAPGPVCLRPQAGVFGGPSFLHALEAGSRTLGLTPINVSVHGIADVEKALAAAADTPDAGLIVGSDAFLFPHRKEISAWAARYLEEAAPTGLSARSDHDRAGAGVSSWSW